MTPKEKAKELVDKFTSEIDKFTGARQRHTTIHAKRCAIICVDEILSAIKQFHNGPDWQLETTMGWEFWNLIKKELEKM